MSEYQYLAVGRLCGNYLSIQVLWPSPDVTGFVSDCRGIFTMSTPEFFTVPILQEEVANFQTCLANQV